MYYLLQYPLVVLISRLVHAPLDHMIPLIADEAPRLVLEVSGW